MDRQRIQLMLLQFCCDDTEVCEVVMGLKDELPPSVSCEEFKIQRQKLKERNKHFYEETIPRYTDVQFIEHFRMNRTTFETLLNAIQTNVQNHVQHFTDIPMEKKLLFCLWLLGKQESFLAVGDRFNIAKSSGHLVFKYMIEEITKLMPKYIKWPNGIQNAKNSSVFKNRSGLNGVIGAIDGCHIPIQQPVGNSQDYYNRKQFHSIILQGVCDSTGNFIDIFIGMPGRMHDARVFKNSPLYSKMTNTQNPLIPKQQHMIGDSAYPLMVNLMTPFRDNGHLDVKETLYNVRFSRIRSIIERAFGRLKGKFRRLKYLCISDIEFGQRIIAAACILHNAILQNGEEVDFDEEMDAMEHQSEQSISLENSSSVIAQQKRKDLMNRLF